MIIRKLSLFAAASAFALTVSAAAWAQSGLKPIPKPSDRRIGELEGWSDAAKPQAGKDAKADKKSAAAKGGKTAKAEKPAAEKSQDGGIPLPRTREDPMDYAPVGFDKDGKLGTGLKF